MQKTCRDVVRKCAEESGFLAFAAENPLSRRDFLEAVKRANTVKEDFITILSEQAALEELLKFCETDSVMQTLLVD